MKFISMLLVLFMVWTVVGKQGIGYKHFAKMVIVIENESGERKVIDTPIIIDVIVGDKVKYIPARCGWNNIVLENEKIERIK